LVNLLDDRQPDHAATSAFFDELSEPPVSTIACLAEAIYLVRKLRGWRHVEMLFELVRDGSLLIAPIAQPDLLRAAQLMTQYQNVPMDFADATLVTVAERLSISAIISIDNDFYIYRLPNDTSFEVLRPG
jgi:predicted nucleic acid-binding protein